ncbi:ATP synthase subunit I [Aquihabitans sp. G128]|uniref:ATP synthase subunit I n=1 Tax=Aquihabitans sp. G128 TaxID=2849779 RepID=UPI001C240AFD|nr:ATP synthase subunit I [Aquihabitans sp. G128]QXC63167.1 ATP synthase subunit I [Aquihabitans sp. G128]
MSTTSAASVIASRDLGPAPERDVARDLIKHGLLALPVALLAGLLGWGTAGLASVAFAAGLVLANFWLAAALLGWAARISLGLLMGVSLFGFLIRIGIIGAAVMAVRNQAWVATTPPGRHPRGGPPRSPLLGDPFRVRIAGLPRPQAHL